MITKFNEMNDDSEMRRGTRIKKICDGITTPYDLKGYIMFEDCWIGKNDSRIIKPVALQEDLNNGTKLSDMIIFS